MANANIFMLVLPHIALVRHPLRSVYCTAKNFHWSRTKNSPNPPSTLVSTEIFHGIKFCPCCKDRHRHCVVINMGGKSRDKSFAHESRVQDGKKFLKEKIPVLTVYYSYRIVIIMDLSDSE